MNIFPILFLIAAIVLVFAFFASYIRLFAKSNPIADVFEKETAALSYPRRRFPMEKTDILPMVIITLAYAVIAFWGLGDKKAPESFCRFAEKGRYTVIELPEETPISRVMYYSGLYTGNYFLQFSLDGENYTDESTMEQKYSDIFKWHEAKLNNISKPVKFIRIISDNCLEMGELCLYDWTGRPIPPSAMKYDAGCAPLFDEQDKVPNEETYMNSAYFDEIYHVRTADEHIRGIRPYENTHPPLGKLIISVGIRIFGLNPFGWRFMGVLFGILMLPPFYIFIKNLFGSTAISACGTLIFAFDFMHFVQTRIATIDTYGVIFIILMYFFMYRYITAPRYDPFMKKRQEVLPLFMSGLCFGLGAASKWTAIYGGAGLAVIWILFRIARGRELVLSGHKKEHRKELAANIFQCFAFFIVIPGIIYYASYYPYGKAEGLSGFSMYFDKDYAKIVLDNQISMFKYHSGVTASHPYSSRWYQWIVDGRPILYFLRSYPDNIKSAFAAFLNPLVCWGGLLAIFAMAWKTVRFRDEKAMFILLGYFAQLVPWMFITRITFEYHYFPCLIFLVLALCHVFNSFRLRDTGWKKKVYGATAACLLLFIAFYPVLTGVPVPRSYTDLLAWIPGAWPF
ncbi:MAG: phospholipid carrier-dependent glycosyltransferase [Clostridiales bacterium]|nr:phospholipid carrier-dependent glycosyltransferase [Clostridiales bacterium]